MRPLLVGELNPYGSLPEFALYPLPENASGGRLARILGLSRGQYMRAFDRVNLCEGTWSMKWARNAAGGILGERIGSDAAIVLLGRKVQFAFGFKDKEQLARVGTRMYLVPHPSGLNPFWNVPGNVERARQLLADVLAPARA